MWWWVDKAAVEFVVEVVEKLVVEDKPVVEVVEVVEELAVDVAVHNERDVDGGVDEPAVEVVDELEVAVDGFVEDEKPVVAVVADDVAVYSDSVSWMGLTRSTKCDH
eukprot:m.102285 g.102285  ORF g.102285 m.102285 type:complete len:107 (+) comp9074_c1_seq18:312-632(+)